MKQIDDIGLFQCKYESQLFEYSTLMKECSSKVFIKAYVFSSVQRRIASQSFIYESLSVSAAYDLIKKEKKLTRGNDIYPSYVMAWIGYIMRYFSCTTNIPETVLYKKIKPEEFYMIYEAYHSLDNELAVKRIAEAKGINLELNNLNILKECNKKYVRLHKK